MPVKLPTHIKESLLMLPEITKIQSRIEEFDKFGDDKGLIVAKLQYREVLVLNDELGSKLSGFMGAGEKGPRHP
jgi:hypothetical protein